LSLTLIRRYMWLLPVAMGIVFIAAGAFMITEGRAAKNEVRTALMDERIITANDASIPGVLVKDATTAQSQSDIIKTHALTTTEGKTYAEMTREDPRRNTYLTSVNLRTSLNLAIMGFKISDLVVGMGAFMVALGLSHVAVLAPVLFWLRSEVPESAKATAAVPASGRAGIPAPTS
jgi:hypothetical protein